MLEEESKCSVCQTATDSFGDHLLCCGGNGDRVHPHDSLRDDLFSTAQSATLASRREMTSLIPGVSSRPTDAYLPRWKRKRPTALDVLVICPLQKLTVQRVAISQSHTLQVGEERKCTSHADACHLAGVFFVPLIVVSLGGWSCKAVETIKAIGRLLGQRMGLPSSESIRHLFE